MEKLVKNKQADKRCSGLGRGETASDSIVTVYACAQAGAVSEFSTREGQLVALITGVAFPGKTVI